MDNKKWIVEKIAGGENVATEFKECRKGIPRNLFETICAFLNRFGGDIILGVSDNGDIIGIEEDRVGQLKKEIVSLCNNPNKIFPTVYFSINTCDVGGKKIIHMYVPESSQVHNSAGRIYDRNEDCDFDVTENSGLIAQIYERKQRKFTENTVYPYATFDDLDRETVNLVRNRAIGLYHQHPWANMNDEEMLKSAGLYKRDLVTGQNGYTLACILLFGKEEAILSAIPYYKTDAIYRNEDFNHYDDRQVVKSNLIKSYGALLEFILKKTNNKFYMEGDTRIDLREKIFREVVANTLIHREYSNAYPATIIVTPDSVVVENGNKPHGPGIVNLDDLIPYPKNPLIGGVFREIGWAEELGSGIRNIKKYSQIYSGMLPKIEDGPVFRTTIYLKKYINTANKNGASADNRENEVYNLIKQNIALSRTDLVNKTGFSMATIDRTIKSLKEKGMIKGRTSDKGGVWIL